MIANCFYILISFVSSCLVGFCAIPMIMKFCKSKRLYDMPNERKVHKGEIPRLGGVCFMPCMLLSMMIAVIALACSSQNLKFSISMWTCYFFIGLLCIYVVGVIDDVIGVAPKMKFLVQIIAASVLPLSGLYINDFCGLFGVYSIPFCIGAPLTVFVIVFIDNAINLIDGIDGLCAGLSLIVLLGYLYLFCEKDMWTYCILIAGLMGSILSFMYFNLFGKIGINKIFMGDSGSLTIGFVVGVLFVKLSMHKSDVEYDGTELLKSYTLLILPIFDVVRVIIVRLFHGHPVFKADKNHIHHKIMRTGLTMHQSLSVIIGIMFFVIMENIILSTLCTLSYIVLIDIMTWMIINGVVNYAIKRNGNKVVL